MKPTLHRIVKIIRTIFVFLYALFLLWLIPAFFINYNGEWIEKVARALPLREMERQQR